MSAAPTMSAHTARPARNPLAPPIAHAFTASLKNGCLTPFESTTHGEPIASEILSAFLVTKFKSPSP